MEMAEYSLGETIEGFSHEEKISNKIEFEPQYLINMIKGDFYFSYLCSFYLDVTSGLDYLHSTANMLHGDLKPANVLYKGLIFKWFIELFRSSSISDGKFKICDFGTTLKLDENKQCSFQDYCTTEPYMPPEG